MNKTFGGEKYIILSESTRSEKVIVRLLSIIELFIVLHKTLLNPATQQINPPCRAREELDPPIK